MPRPKLDDWGYRWDSRVDWVVADPAAIGRHSWLQSGLVRLLPWRALGGAVGAGEVRALRIVTGALDARTGLPPYLERLTGLECLELPAALAPSLRSEDIPRSVRTLQLASDDESARNAVLPADQQFPHVRCLMGPVAFQPGSFPALEALWLWLGREVAMLDTIAEVRRLKALGLFRISGTAFPEKLAPLALRLRRLHLRRGKGVVSLDGVERFSRLTRLDLFDFPKLVDLAPVAKLPRLRVLELSYCKRVSLNALVRSTSLRHLSLFGLDDRRLAKATATLKKRGVRVGL
jgi:hypothetical protein